MTEQTDAGLVDEYGTRFTRTSVRQGPGQPGYRWVRFAGPERTDQMRAPSAEVAASIRRLPAPGLGLALPVQEADRLVYQAKGPESLANLLMREKWTVSYPIARSLLSGLGGRLRELHAISSAGLLEEKHPGILRLSAWLGSGKGGGESGRLFAMAGRRLGPDRLDRLGGWCSFFLSDTPEAVLLHGKPGTGLVVPSASGAGGVLLIGEDMAAGRASLDIGWVLGELAELRGVIRAKDSDRAAQRWSTLGQSFLDGYVDRIPEQAGMAATLAVLTHLRDYCEFVGWNEWWIPLILDIVAEECDRSGSGNISWSQPA